VLEIIWVRNPALFRVFTWTNDEIVTLAGVA
jgi:hypothetical protein